MGLDMYLYKMKRYKDADPKDIIKIEDYLDWREYMSNNDRKKDYTLEEWCGVKEEDIPMRFLDFYRSYYKKNEYGIGTVRENIGYWRKANQIHNWFVNNVQDGEDDCEFHNEVTEENLANLLHICEKIVSLCPKIGYDEYDCPSYKVNKAATKLAMESLPTTSGFFFGGCNYDSYYVSQLIDTIDICKNALANTNFEKEMIYYRSSW